MRPIFHYKRSKFRSPHNVYKHISAMFGQAFLLAGLIAELFGDKSIKIDLTGFSTLIILLGVVLVISGSILLMRACYDDLRESLLRMMKDLLKKLYLLQMMRSRTFWDCPNVRRRSRMSRSLNSRRRSKQRESYLSPVVVLCLDLLPQGSAFAHFLWKGFELILTYPIVTDFE